MTDGSLFAQGLVFFVDEHSDDEALDESRDVLAEMLLEDELREVNLAIVTISHDPARKPLPEESLVNKLGLDRLTREYQLFRCGHLDVSSQEHVTNTLKQMLRYCGGLALQQAEVPQEPQETLELVNLEASQVWCALTPEKLVGADHEGVATLL